VIGCGAIRAVLLAAAAMVLAGRQRPGPVITPEMEDAARVVMAKEATAALGDRLLKSSEDDLFRRIFGEDPTS
jgi:hypothetical protein